MKFLYINKVTAYKLDSTNFHFSQKIIKYLGLVLIIFIYSETLLAQSAPITQNDTLCGGGVIHLSAKGCDGGIIKYYDAAIGGSLVFTGADYSPDLNETDTFYVSCTLNGIESDRSMVIGKIYIPPTADAGPDQSICADSFQISSGMISLKGNFGGSADSGAFYCLDCPVDTTAIGDIHAFTTTVKAIGICPPPSNCTFSFSPTSGCAACGSLAGDFHRYTLVFVTNDPPGPCEPAVDTVVISIYPSNSTNAGGNQVVCAGAPVQLNGFIYGSTTGMYSGGAGTFSGDVITPTPSLGGSVITNTYYPTADEVAAGSVKLVLTNINPTVPCPDSLNKDTAVIVFSTPTANAGPDQTICAGDSAILIGFYSDAATSGSFSGGGGIIHELGGNAFSYQPSPAEIAAGSVTLTYTTNDPPGDCPAASDDVKIAILPAATADAGPDQKICGKEFLASGMSFQLKGTFGGSADSGTFYCLNCNLLQSNPGVQAATTVSTIGICPPPSNCTFSYKPLITFEGPCPPGDTCKCNYTDSTEFVFPFVTNDPEGSCGPASDTTKVTIYSYDHAIAGADQSICAGESILLKGTVEKISVTQCRAPGTGSWSGGTGVFSGDVNLPNGTVTNTYTPSPEEVAAGSVRLILRSTVSFGDSPCPPASDTILVTIKQCNYYCTYSHGFYGSKNGKACTTSGTMTANELIIRSISNMPGQILYIGSGSNASADGGSLTITESQSSILNSILPGGGPSSILSADYNFNSSANYPPLKNDRLKNQLLSQTITLALNIYQTTDARTSLGNIALSDIYLITGERSSLSSCSSPQPSLCTDDPSSIKSWLLPANVLKSLGTNNKILDLFHLAGEALAGNIPNGVTLQDIAAAEEIINSAFEGCRYLVGFSACKKTCANLEEKCPLTIAFEKPRVSLNTGSKNLKATVYPNPYNDHLKFIIESPFSGHGTLDIYNVTGQKLQVFQGTFVGGKTKIIDYKVPVEKRSNLIYILSVGEQRVSGKIVH